MKNNLAQKFNYYTLIRYSAPATIMLVFMSLYQMVDGVFLSNIVGEDALSALNVLWPAISLLNAVTVMLASGGVAVVSKKMGENKYDEAQQIFTMIIVVASIFALVYAGAIVLCIEPILRFLGATDLLLPYAIEYLRVMAICSIFGVLQIIMQFFFVCAGKSHIGLLLTISAGIANVVFDYLFMAVLGLGMAGAAWGTLVGQAIIGIIGILYFMWQRKGTLYLVPFTMRYRVLLKICTNGSSEMVSNLAYAITTILFNITMLAYLQEAGIAAISIILYAQYVFSSLFVGFSTGVAPIISYQYGRQDHKQLKRLYKMSRVIILCFSIFIFSLSIILAQPLISIFTSPTSDVFAIADQGFKLFAISFLFSGTNIFASNLFTAFSNGKVSALISFMRTFICIVLCLLILPKVLGIVGIWLAIPFAEAISLLSSLFFFKKYKKLYHY